jgi:hypothetical protein
MEIQNEPKIKSRLDPRQNCRSARRSHFGAKKMTLHTDKFTDEQIISSFRPAHELFHLSAFRIMARASNHDDSGSYRIESVPEGGLWRACPPGYQDAPDLLKWSCLMGGVVAGASFRERILEIDPPDCPLIMIRRGLVAPMTSDSDAREVLGQQVKESEYDFVRVLWSLGRSAAESADTVARILAIGNLISLDDEVDVPLELLDVLSRRKVELA